MNFKINNRDWKIVELSQDEMRNVIKNYKYDGEPKEGKYFGLTYIDSQIIYIDEDLCKQQKRQTLLHELMHCYIGSYLFSNSRDYTEEDLCNISSCSHDIINKIINDYFERK